jgi:hypothetical protein
MDHLSLDIICRIADGEIHSSEMEVYISHWKACSSCQQEVDLQRSMMKVTQQARLINPTSQFTRNVLDSLIPSKKRWYEWILHNLGNIIAMTSVLTFLGYLFSAAGNSPLPNQNLTNVGPILDYFKIFQNSSKQLGSYLVQKSHVQIVDPSQTNTIAFALLAIFLLVFIDKIAGHFLYRSKL